MSRILLLSEEQARIYSSDSDEGSEETKSQRLPRAKQLTSDEVKANLILRGLPCTQEPTSEETHTAQEHNRCLYTSLKLSEISVVTGWGVAQRRVWHLCSDGCWKAAQRRLLAGYRRVFSLQGTLDRANMPGRWKGLWEWCRALKHTRSQPEN